LIPENDDVTLIFSFVGFIEQEIVVDQQRNLDVELEASIAALDEVVVVGYGTQKRSDVTGSVASLPMDRLDGVPNANLTKAIQGAISCVAVQTTSAGARSFVLIIVKGRNSVNGSNSPFVGIDEIDGNLSGVILNVVLSVEVIKDA